MTEPEKDKRPTWDQVQRMISYIDRNVRQDTNTKLLHMNFETLVSLMRESYEMGMVQGLHSQETDTVKGSFNVNCTSYVRDKTGLTRSYGTHISEQEQIQQLFDLAKDGERFLQTGNIFIYRFSSTSMGNSPTEIRGLEPIAHWVMNGTWRRA
jgi:hypothetical protein